jgi:hypothetical protein
MIDSCSGTSTERTFAELLIDCEEDRTLRAVLVGMLREDEKRRKLAKGVDASYVVKAPSCSGLPAGVLVSPALRAFAEPDGPTSSVRLLPGERRQGETYDESDTRDEDSAP